MPKIVKAAISRFFIAVATFLVIIASHAKPVWTFTPSASYPPSVSITPSGSAFIQYTIINQSRKTHQLTMKPIAGITQITTTGNCSNPFTLGYLQSCTLTLFVDGKLLTHNIKDGPIFCQQRSSLECYRPGLTNVLNITLIPEAQYVITPSTDGKGTITPSTPQTVEAGSSLSFSATPNSSKDQVDEWLVDGDLAQTGGSTFTLFNINSNHTVEVTFSKEGTIYTGASNGNVYFSINKGLNWLHTSIPSPGNAVNSVFATTSVLYAGSADGFVYYSSNNGTSWDKGTAPDTSAINSVFVTTVNNNEITYVGTQNGKVYYSTDQTNWTPTAVPSPGNAVNSLYIASNGYIYVGSNDGNVYFSTNNGLTWTTIIGPAGVGIKDVFVTNKKLYVNTTAVNDQGPYEYVYTSKQLTSSGSWEWYAQVAYSLFVSSDESVIYAGTQDGYIFSLLTGNEVGFITYTKLNSVFFLGKK